MWKIRNVEILDRVIITSKDKKDVKFPDGIRARVNVKKDFVEWIFPTVEQTEKAMNVFCNADYEYVRRITA